MTKLMTKRMRQVLLWLLTAMVLAQTVGLLHRVVHAKRDGEVVASASLHATASSFSALWGEHSNASDCQQFDQSCPDLLFHTAWSLPVQTLPALWLLALLRERFALFERFYAARGPPPAFAFN